MTQYENGDRYIYVVHPLPSEIELDGHICRVSHKSQSYKCQRCSQSLCDIAYDNTSEFNSAEHAYQYAKCSFFNKRDIAQKILLALTAKEA